MAPRRPTGARADQSLGHAGISSSIARATNLLPVTTEAYAIKIARDWNVPASGMGYVTRFRIAKAFLDQYEVHLVGGNDFQEYWIPAHQLQDFNNALIGPIEVVAEFGS